MSSRTPSLPCVGPGALQAAPGAGDENPLGRGVSAFAAARATVGAVLLATGALLAPSAPVLIVADATAGRVVLCRPLPPSAHLALAFDHSMYGGDVIEEYVPTRQDRLLRTAMTTANAAAAEHYADTAGVVPDGNRFRVDVPPAELTEIVVRVDRVGAHRLRLEGETIDLLTTTGDRHQVRLALRSAIVADRLIGTGC